MTFHHNNLLKIGDDVEKFSKPRPMKHECDFINSFHISTHFVICLSSLSLTTNK